MKETAPGFGPAKLRRAGRSGAGQAADYAAAMEDVALELLGEPSSKKPGELRFGTRGSLAVNTDAGTWFDHETGGKGGVLALVLREKPELRDNAGARAWLAEQGLLAEDDGPRAKGKAGRKIVATYHYEDERGELLFEAVRYEPKKFSQRRPDGKGDHIWNMDGVRFVPFLLPELLAAPPDAPVFVCEGEKAVLAMVAHGLVATCSHGGANKPGRWDDPRFVAPFAGRDVIVLPDNDDAGAKHAELVRAGLRSTARSVRVLPLPELPAKGDAHDWFAADGTAAELLRRVAELPGEAAPAADPVADACRALRAKLAQNKHGIVPTHANLLRILQDDPRLAGLVRKDDFSLQIVLTRPVPVVSGEPEPAERCPRPWADEDTVQLLAFVQERWSPGFLRSTVKDCVRAEAKNNAFHPLRDWLAGLRWDGTERLDKWLATAFGCPDDAYHRAVGSKLLIAAVRRVREPGCKWDHVVILRGKQGIGKSTAIRKTFGDDYYTDDVCHDLSSKDAALGLVGKWVHELSEIVSLIRSSNEAAKGFLSRLKDRFRPPYGESTIEVPRQSVLVGTTNDQEFLRDPTGNRRYLIVDCRKADVARIEADREQLWAEAAAREAKGEEIWLNDVKVKDAAEEAQASSMIEDAWESRVLAFVTKHPYVNTTDILEKGIGIALKDIDRKAQMRAGDILRQNGWTNALMRHPATDDPGRWWRKPDQAGDGTTVEPAGDGTTVEPADQIEPWM